jgi:putative FmdB family regulatory protein
MPVYEYRCLDCRKVFGIERPMSDTSAVTCQECSSEKVSRIWNAFIRSGGITPDVGQGTSKSTKSASAGGGCGSCSSSSCGTCH